MNFNAPSSLMNLSIMQGSILAGKEPAKLKNSSVRELTMTHTYKTNYALLLMGPYHIIMNRHNDYEDDDDYNSNGEDIDNDNDDEDCNRRVGTFSDWFPVD